MWTAWLMAASDTTTDWVGPLLQGGILGVLTLLWVLDKVGNNSERNRLREENATLRAELRDQNESIRRELVPPLVELTRLLPQLLEQTIKLQRER